jgi:7,8-dihydro-6-hydroxymethylpterin dimethyltransferase
MDMNTMLEERLMQCCVHVGTRSGSREQCAPFCAVQAWAPLGEMKIGSAGRRRTIPLTVS